MTEGEPEPEYPPITATYEHADGVRQGEIFPTTYVRFARQPPDIVLRTINGRFSFYWSKIRRTWRGPRENWPECEAFLKSEGLDVVAGSVGDGMTRRDRQARDKKREAEGVGVGPTLAGFDFSHFPQWAKENFVIKDKETGVFVPFVLNSDQHALFIHMLDQWRRTGRVRINIVKHRQRGISTFIQLFILFLCLHVPGVEALVTAHRDDAALAVFRRAKIAEARCPLKRELHLNNRRELQFREPWNSALRVAVAGGDDGVGRGEMRQVYHASEPAHYNKSGVEAQGNIEASIPDSPGTFIWRETTANGKNHFYDAHENAQIAGFENHFIGFLGDETCRLYNVTLDDERWARVPIEWMEDEPRIRGLAKERGFSERETVAALCFRRQAIAQKCMGLPPIFQREFPATVSDSFASTGCHAFPLSVVDEEWERAKEAERKNPVLRFTVNRSTKEIAPDPYGRMRIWKHPEPGNSYIVSGDFASGKSVSGQGGDPSKLDATTFGVLEEHTLEEVAVWHARQVDPDLAAREMAIIGAYYNNAVLIPEANTHGQTVVNTLIRDVRYPRVFRKERIDKPTAQPIRQNPDSAHHEYGWWTGATMGKNAMVNWLRVAIRERTMTFNDPDFWSEARDFVIDEDGDANAMSGKHDDAVIRGCILASYITLHPKPRRPVARTIPPPAVSADGTAFILNMKAIADKAKARRESEARKARGNWA